MLSAQIGIVTLIVTHKELFVSSRLIVVIALLGQMFCNHAAIGQLAEDQTNPAIVTIATAGVSGTYYPVGSAVCQMVNEHTLEHGLRCAVASSEGSIANLRGLRQGELQLAMVQSDWQFHAYRGTSVFSEIGPDSSLRSLFSLHNEPFTIVARSDAAIDSIDDLRGKRVNIGNPGSGQRATLQVLLIALGWTLDDLGATLELPLDRQAAAMCDDEVDAIVFVGGHPNRSVLEATTLCDAVIVAATGPAVDKLILFQPYYSYAVISGGMYRNNPVDIPSFGVTATLVAHEKLAEQAAYLLTRNVFENLAAFKMLHPSLAGLERQQMLRTGLTAPLHPGAVRYYREIGLLTSRPQTE